MIAGRDFGLCMEPEFLRSHSSENDFLNPRITVIGEFDKQSGDVLEKLYADRFEGQIFRVDLKTAEFMKYVHNCFNAAKISFSNEMWLIGEKLGIKDPNLALEISNHICRRLLEPRIWNSWRFSLCRSLLAQGF